MLLGGALLALSAAGARAQTPAYYTTELDDVTGDNAPVIVSPHPGLVSGGCDAAAPCWVPDPGADSYSNDKYERPMGRGRYGDEYYPSLDITSSQVGYDDEWLYYRINVYGTEGGGLYDMYGFEINYDEDGIGDIFVTASAPGVSTTWTSAMPVVYWDQDNNVGGPNPTRPDGQGSNANGYENKVFNGGLNKVPGSPGGVNAVQVRIAPDNPAAVELAVHRSFMEGIKGGVVERAAFRPYTSRTTVSPASIYLHDDMSRTQMGSPYPWIKKGGATTFCPHNEPITSGEEEGLESGTHQNTGRANPCYPAQGWYEGDNGGAVAALSEGTVGTINFYTELGVTKQAPDTVALGDTLTYTVTVANHEVGFGEATGVAVFDSLPGGVTLVSAVPSQGSCVEETDYVHCSLGDLPNYTGVATVEIRVVADSVGAIYNTAWVVADPTDTDPSNDSATVGTLVLDVIGVSATPDGGSASHLPSNGTPYSATFQVSHTGGSDALLYLSASGDTSVLAVDSITADGFVRGAAPWEGHLSVAADSTADVFVYFRVLDAEMSASGALLLSVTGPDGVARDSAWTDVTVVRPALAISKGVDASGTVRPGEDLTYALTVENVGQRDARSVTVVDLIPAELSFKLGSISTVFASGVDATAEFSMDGGASWSYAPASGGCGAPDGYDGCVTHIRWALSAPLSSDVSISSGEIRFTARVE